MRLDLAKPVAVVVCVAGLLLSSCGSSGKEVSTASGGNGAVTTTTSANGENEDSATETTEATEATTSTTEAKKDSGPAIDVAETGFSTYKEYDDSTAATAAAVLKNTGSKQAEFFEVVFSFKDASGKPVGTESTTVYAVGGGATGYAVVTGVDLTGEPTSVDASAVLDESYVDVIDLAVTVEALVPEEYGDGIQVNGIAENKTNLVFEYFGVSCVLRSGGRIVGGATGTLDTLVPGGSITWEASGPVKADAAECAASGAR